MHISKNVCKGLWLHWEVVMVKERVAADGSLGFEVKRRQSWGVRILCVCAALIMPAGCGGSLLYTPRTLSDPEEDQLVFNNNNSFYAFLEHCLFWTHSGLFMKLAWPVAPNGFAGLFLFLETFYTFATCVLQCSIHIMHYGLRILVLRTQRKSCLKKCRARRRRPCRPALHLMPWQRKPYVPVVALR